jgi:predicted dehydrogenase
MSLSILQTNPAAARIRRRLDEVGKVSFGTITCWNTHRAALIHAISIAHHVFGTGVRAVSCLKARNHTALHLDYGTRADRPEHGVVINCGTARFRFTEMFVTAYGPEGAIQAKAMDDFDASEGSAIILERVKRMVKTGQPDPLSDEMVQAIAIADACRAAERTGRRAKVPRV